MAKRIRKRGKGLTVEMLRAARDRLREAEHASEVRAAGERTQFAAQRARVVEDCAGRALRADAAVREAKRERAAAFDALERARRGEVHLGETISAFARAKHGLPESTR